jgi:hypothetical protein
VSIKVKKEKKEKKEKKAKTEKKKKKDKKEKKPPESLPQPPPVVVDVEVDVMEELDSIFK